MCSNGFSEIRRGMDCGKEAGNFLEDFMNDGPVAQHLEEQDNRNRDILRRLREIDAPAELKEEVRDAVAQNANTVLVLIDEVRRVYPDYRLYPACEVERLIDILEIIACAGGPMVRGLIQDLFRDWPIGPRETNYYRKDGKDYREKQGRP